MLTSVISNKLIVCIGLFFFFEYVRVRYVFFRIRFFD
jgi:hypothetical protein